MPGVQEVFESLYPPSAQSKGNAWNEILCLANMMSEIREAIEEHRYSEYKRQKLEGFQNQE